MGAKIILSLSTLRESAHSYSYKCPGGGSTCSVVQTNEAPVKYLISQDRTISQVICLVTPIAKKTALPHFQADIRKVAPSVKLITIDAPDNGQLPDETMANLLHQLKKGDTVTLYCSNKQGNIVPIQLILFRKGGILPLDWGDNHVYDRKASRGKVGAV